jgi:hypothetical protein
VISVGKFETTVQMVSQIMMSFCWMVQVTFIFSYWCIIKAVNATVLVECKDSHRNTYLIDPEDISLESDKTSEGRSIIKLPIGGRTLCIPCGVSVSSDSSSDPNPDNKTS